MKKRTLDNDGFSLIELIVAVLIIAIVSSAAIMTFGFTFGMNAEKAAKSLTDAMKQARTEALGRENKASKDPLDPDPDVYDVTNVYVKIKPDGSKIYAEICTNATGSETVLRSQELCSNVYSIDFYQVDTTDDSETKIASVGNDTVYVYFKKSTGGVACVKYVRSGSLSLSYHNVQLIKVSSGTADVTEIVLVQETGRCFVDE